MDALVSGRSLEPRVFLQLDSPADRAVPAVAFS
jgi:hypothetical protein